jgi:PBP1b-binding outer membrane lipoprotein LpoB
MKLAVLPALAFLLLTACVEEPTPQQAEKANEANEANEAIDQDVVKKRQLSIEEAAEEATKLIEADAKAEVDAIAENSAN